MDLGKTFPFEFPLEELAAAFAESTYGRQQPVYSLFLVELRRRVVAGIGERKVINRFLIIFASSERLAMGVQHLESEDLKGQRNQFGQIRNVGVFLMEDHQHLLSQILGLCPRYS